MNNREEQWLLSDVSRMREELTGANDQDQQQAIYGGMQQTRGESGSDRGRSSRYGKEGRWGMSWRRTAMAAVSAVLLLTLVLGIPQLLPAPTPGSSQAPEISTLPDRELDAFLQLAGASGYKQSIQSALRHGYYFPIRQSTKNAGSTITLQAAIAQHDLLFLLYTLHPPQGKAVHGLNQLLLQDSATGKTLALLGLSDLNEAKQVIAKDLSRAKKLTDKVGIQSSELLGRTDPTTGQYNAIGIVRLESGQSFPEQMMIHTHFSVFDTDRIGSPADKIEVQLAKSDVPLSLDQEQMRKGPFERLLVNQDLEQPVNGQTYHLQQVDLTPLEITATLTSSSYGAGTEYSGDLISPMLITGSGNNTTMLRPTLRSIPTEQGNTHRTFHFSSSYLDQPKDIQLLVRADTSDEQYENFIELDLKTRKIIKMPEQLKDILKVTFLKDKGFELRQRSPGRLFYVTDLNTGRLFYEQAGEDIFATYNVIKQTYDPLSNEWVEVYKGLMNSNGVQYLKIPIEQAEIIKVR